MPGGGWWDIALVPEVPMAQLRSRFASFDLIRRGGRALGALAAAVGLAGVSVGALGAPTHAAIDSASWSQTGTVKNKEVGPVGIWRAQIGGVDCFRGTATTDVSPEKLFDVVADVEGAKRWSSAGITEAKTLARSSSQMAYYQYLDIPGWTMAADRFWFLKADLHRGSDRASLKWTPLGSGGGPHAAEYQRVTTEHPNAVEPTVNVGSWVFEAGSAGVRMTYSICTKPGGSIPSAIQNAATKRTLPDTLGDVVREARRR